MQPSDSEELHHTADWALRVSGKSLDELFVHAALGMQAMMGIEITQDTDSQRYFETSATDLETLLVRFLEEILYLLESENIRITGIKINERTETHLQSLLTCKPVQSIQKEIKAVTFHELEIHRGPGHFETVLVFDV